MYLFAIVFYWTPPHFWALSLLMKDEYAKVGVPMMPVVRASVRRGARSCSTRCCCTPSRNFRSARASSAAIYLAASMLLGLAFIGGAVMLYRRADRRTALRLYLFSLVYLALLFGAMVADVKSVGSARRWTASSPARTSASA